MTKQNITKLVLLLFVMTILSACGGKEFLPWGDKSGTVQQDEASELIQQQDDVPESIQQQDDTENAIESSEDIPDEHVILPGEPIDLNGTYDQNDLLVHTLEEEYEGVVLEIPQISGLKDKAVEAKINQDILQRVETMYKSSPDLRFLSHSTLANFANVLSISVYMAWDVDDRYDQVYLNYNLTNGERLAFEDLFLSDADVLGIIHNAFRDMLITSQMQGNYDENKLYKIVKSYSNASDKEFAFTPSSILLYYKDYVASVKMMDIADEVAVYSRFITEESIYERNDIGRRHLFTCMDVPEDLFDVWEFGLLEENFWYDYLVLEEHLWEETEEMHLDKYREFTKEIYEEIYLSIGEYRKIARANPDSFYILLMKPNIFMESEQELIGDEWHYTYNGRACVSKNIQFIEMPRHMYEDVYKEKLLAAYRYDYLALSGGIYLDITEENVVSDQIFEDQYYDYITGELLETVS